MPVPVVYRLSLTTIHETMQNTTDLNRNSTVLTSHSHGHLESGLIIALNVLLIILIYLCFYKYFFRRHPTPSNSHHNSTATTPTPDSSSPASSPRSNGRALELHLLSSIPVVEFKRIHEEKAECAVCLAEFKDGDRLRVLPPCSHRFHVDCVDTWFQSHANCPLCRTLVEEKAAAGSESMV